MQKSNGGSLSSWAASRIIKFSIISVVALSILVFFLFPASVTAVGDPPHNDASGVNCGSCHGKSLLSGQSPFWSDDNKSDSAYNSICMDRCHVGGVPPYGATSGPVVQSHAPGGTVIKCTVCHHNHEQEQIYPGKYDKNNFFIATGTVSTPIAAEDYDEGSNTTTIKYSKTTTLPDIFELKGKGDWSDLTTLMTKTSTSRGAMLVPDTSVTSSRWPVYLIESIDTDAGTITVKGELTSANQLGIFYGQLIRSMMLVGSEIKYVEFFDKTGAKGFAYDESGIGVDPTPYGICQVCHKNEGATTGVKYWKNDGTGTSHNPDTDCMGCHLHTRGFSHKGDGGATCSSTDCHDTNKHPSHLGADIYCSSCHDMDDVKDISPIDDLDKCVNCHKNPSTGLGPNEAGYEDGWTVSAYDLNCASCHDGRPKVPVLPDTPDYPEEAVPSIGHDGTSTCTDCHTTHLVECHGLATPALNEAAHIHEDGDGNHIDCPHDGPDNDPGDGGVPLDCGAVGCHDGSGTTGLPKAPNFKPDWQRPRIGMRNAGHERLVSTKWIRQYDCYYCHADTVDASWNLSGLHTNDSLSENGFVDVAIASEWEIFGEDKPSYNPVDKNCSDTYCHSDGTEFFPIMRKYPWTGGHEDCNACHGHDDSQDDCIECHANDAKHTWSPEKKWISAMPMYENTGPYSDKANSHFRHLFTGFSCDDCHATTVVGACVDCHTDSIPLGTMGESQHINPATHVDTKRTVVFKDTNDGNASYDEDSKTCSATVCHTGGPSVWGDLVTGSVTCLECHFTDGPDVDSIDQPQGRINEAQWDNTGHGKQSGTYVSGNLAAAFPGIGCWYCHDNKILHGDEDNPYRLRKHEHFKNRYEKECVYCHMVGEDAECLNCHNSVESLSKQLADIGALPGVINNPPYTIERPDHSGYTAGGCSAAGCHVGDTTRHKTDSGVWTREQDEDVEHSYLMMGVCLICHDDDSNNQCSACHADDLATTGVDESAPYALGFDPELPGSTFIKPQDARASSFHFGYKHYISYENSVGIDALYTGTASATATIETELIDGSNTWPAGLVGKTVMINSGDINEESRKIKSNTATILTLEKGFTNPVALNDPYKIVDPVWKGGKFCWDCHDPHGDDNLYMIQNRVATRTDGLFGIPLAKEEVVFTNASGGSGYARTEAPFNGLCNVCHTSGSQYYTSTYGDGAHHSATKCTNCHEHRFTDSHSGGDPCNKCHENKPVPRHSGFGLPRDCTKCHSDVIGLRMNVMSQMQSKSHHVQDVPLTNMHCYQCHWESDEHGLVDNDYHEGYNTKTHVSIKGGEILPKPPYVDLVLWTAEDTAGGEWENDNPAVGSRPIVYSLDDPDAEGPGVPTAIQFLASNISGEGLAAQRAEVDSITVHCLSCHSDQNNDSIPFDDCKTPRKYAWDRSSIGARYSDLTTTTWGKYSGANVAEKNITKAFSAHGNAVNNGGGFDVDDGEDKAITDTRDGLGGTRNYNVQCFDCHSSHGSKAEGTTSSYTTFNGSKNGGNLKETQGGKGGYIDDYVASENLNQASINPFKAGSGQCFDCHESVAVGTQTSFESKSPWGYTETFGATAPVLGYRDTLEFGQSDRGLNDVYPFKPSTILGGHLKASSALGIAAMGTIDGLCTPCHDPHGVSPTLGDKMEYGVPLLKGTWMTSPYKDDTAGTIGDGTSGNDYYRTYNNNWSASYPRPPQMRADGRDPGAWRTDRNTFNTTDLSQMAPAIKEYDRIDEGPETFAGLCLRCHPKDSLTTEVSAEDTDTLAWKGKERIHRTVQGWGWNDGDASREHSFTCSKCHSPHVSALPRLMKTNCLDSKHRGEVPSGGAPTEYSGNYLGKFPFGWWTKGQFSADSTSTCHGADTANGSTGWPNNQGWNNMVTPW